MAIHVKWRNIIMQSSQLVFDRLMSNGRDKHARLALAAMLGEIPDFDLACVGISIAGLGACTFKAVAYMVSADVVYCYPPDKYHYELVKMLNPTVVNMHDELYKRGNQFENSYQTIMNEVMSVVRTGKRVAYATQGSPAFHCGTAVSLHRRANQEGYSSVLVSGVSSFELLSAELSMKYEINTIQITSVLDLVVDSTSIDRRRHCLLFDLSRYVLPTVRAPSESVNISRLTAVSNILRSIYGLGHSVILMIVLTNGTYSKETVNLADFENAVFHSVSIPTVFIPAQD
jgi:hypothetical protein